jgi:hypothetical protein
MHDAAERAEGDDCNEHTKLVRHQLGEVVRGVGRIPIVAVKQCAGFGLVGNQDIHLIPRQRRNGSVAVDRGWLDEDLGAVAAGEADGLAEGRHRRLER